MNLYEQVIARWKGQSLSRRPAVTWEDLSRFEESRGVKVPPDLRRVFLLSNGLAEGEYDQKSQIRFWPLEELALVTDCAPELTSTSYEGHLVFADYSIWSHGYSILPVSGEIFIVGAERPMYVADSMERFLTLYLSDSPGLFFQNPRLPISESGEA